MSEKQPTPTPTAEEMKAFDDATTKWCDDAPEYARARMYRYLNALGMTMEKAHKILVKAGASD